MNTDVLLDENGFLSEKFNSYRNDTKDKNKDLFDLIYKINRFSYGLYSNIKCNKNDIIGIYYLLFYGKILRAYQASIILIEGGLEIEANSNFRVMLETIFILQALHKDKDNFNKLKEHYNSMQHSTLNKIRNYTHLKHLKNSVKDMEIDGNCNKISVERWAQLADMSELYQTVYLVLSDDVHVNLSRIEENIIKNDEGNVDGIKILPEFNDTFLTSGSITDLMIKAIKIMCDYFKINIYDFDVNKFETDLEVIWNKYYDI